MASTCSDAVVVAPRPGTTVALTPGSRLCLRLRTGLGPSRWCVTERPGHLLPLGIDGGEVTFLVFDGEPATVRLERRHPRGDVVREVCELRVEVIGTRELAHSA